MTKSSYTLRTLQDLLKNIPSCNTFKKKKNEKILFFSKIILVVDLNPWIITALLHRDLPMTYAGAVNLIILFFIHTFADICLIKISSNCCTT